MKKSLTNLEAHITVEDEDTFMVRILIEPREDGWLQVALRRQDFPDAFGELEAWWNNE